jgi:hypothetical protein
MLMRKSLWIIALLLAVVAAPSAYADSFDASFTCTGSCVAVPTDPPVTFPGPNIPISFFSQTFTITLHGQDLPTDSFTWGVKSDSSSWSFVINDLTTGLSDLGPSFNFGQGGGAPYGEGKVCFQTAPEPEASALLLLGVGIVLLVRKRMRQGIPQSS